MEQRRVRSGIAAAASTMRAAKTGRARNMLLDCCLTKRRSASRHLWPCGPIAADERGLCSVHAIQPLHSRRSCSRTESRLQSVCLRVHPTILSRLCFFCLRLPLSPARRQPSPANGHEAKRTGQESRGGREGREAPQQGRRTLRSAQGTHLMADGRTPHGRPPCHF